MYLGIDLGTSSLKLLLLSEAHQTVACAEVALTLQHPQPHWSEQHPADWWTALAQAVAQLRDQHAQAWRKVRAVGLSGQMHGAVLLDAHGQVLRPAILWNDGRSAAQCQALEQAQPRLRQITGNLAMPGLTAPKLLWLREHEPEVFARTARVLLPKDWLRLCLSSEAISDMSDASGTLWLDVARRRWDESLLAACGLGLAHMPRLVEGSDLCAQIKPSLAQAWGWQHPVWVAGGAGDNAATAVGVGALADGQGFVSLGTSGVVFRASAHFAPAPERAVHTFAHAVPGRWHQMAVMLSAAQALAWLARWVGQPEGQLSALVERLPLAQRARAPLFLPYLQGERTPHNRPQLRASWSGLHSSHGLADLTYAVMEGVAFGLLDGWRALDGPARPQAVFALVGGGAQSQTWAQLLADVLQCPLRRSGDAPVAAALGAARLALFAEQGAERALPEVAAHRLFEPGPLCSAVLMERYARFQRVFVGLHDGA